MFECLIKLFLFIVKFDDLLLFLLGQFGYDDVMKVNGLFVYDKVDIQGVKDLFVKVGLISLMVKFVYVIDNLCCVSEFQLLQVLVVLVGIMVVDVGKLGFEFFGDSGFGSGKYDYDVCVFVWQLSFVVVIGNQGVFQMDGGSNFQGYFDLDVDVKWKKIVSEILDVVVFLMFQEIDVVLFKNVVIMLLFQLLDVLVWFLKIFNVKDVLFSLNIFWNFWEWSEFK